MVGVYHISLDRGHLTAVRSSEQRMQMPLTSDLHPAMEVTAAENRKAKPQMHSNPVTCPSCSP